MKQHQTTNTQQLLVRTIARSVARAAEPANRCQQTHPLLSSSSLSSCWYSREDG